MQTAIAWRTLIPDTTCHISISLDGFAATGGCGPGGTERRASAQGEGTPTSLGVAPGIRRVGKPVAVGLVVLTLALLVAACGGGDDEAAQTSGGSTMVEQEPEAATQPESSDFPAPKGRTLAELAKLARPGAELAPATSHYVTGENRFAFGLLAADHRFIYAPSAVYVGRTPDDKASGPFLAPADSLLTEARFRSKQAALEGDAIASIYAAELDLPRPGRYAILVLTRAGDQLFGVTSQLDVQRDDPIPAPGDRPPPIETDTVASAGQIENIDTRVPPSDLHANFADVVGRKPVALLFATPQLCQSRVCGPVTDIAVQLSAEYGDEVEFIHQEVYVDNEANKGLREPLLEFGLITEPWLFTFDSEGRVVTRLEGSFGISAFEEAVKAAL